MKSIHSIKVRMCSNDCCVREPDDHDHETESDILSDSESEDDEIIRAKWMFDGCSTLDAIIKRLQEHIVYIEELKSEGWQLTGPVEDDYGFMKKPKVEN